MAIDLQRRLAVFLHQCDHNPQCYDQHEKVVYEQKAELVLDWVVEHGGFDIDPDEWKPNDYGAEDLSG